AQEAYPLVTTPDGGAELEPAALLGAVRHCLGQTMRVYRTDPELKARPIVGIGISCFWHSLIGVNAKGEAITRIITWADSRCRAPVGHRWVGCGGRMRNCGEGGGGGCPAPGGSNGSSPAGRLARPDGRRARVF